MEVDGEEDELFSEKSVEPAGYGTAGSGGYDGGYW